MRCLNPVEKLVYQTLTWTWPLYALGALYVVGPVLAWLLGGFAVLALYLGPVMQEGLRATGSVPAIIWGWILGMLILLAVLWIGHSDWDLGLKATIKSTIGWAKGWALLAIFPLIGAVLPIRRSVLVRGQCVIGLWTLILAPVLLAAPYIGLPDLVYTSPIKAVGGPGPEYFSVFLFSWDPSNWLPRWQFYAPWSPFAALLGVVMVLFALEEKELNWRSFGVAAGILMVLASKSRMGMIGLVICTSCPRLIPLLLRGWTWYALAAFTASLTIFGRTFLASILTAISAFKNARAESTRIRSTLQRMAIERWQTESYWFGHGRVQPGGHIVEYMPIGSHHTWFGLLFVKGMIGFLALLVPFVWQTALAIKDSVFGPRGYLPLGIMMTLSLLSFGENIEIEAYLLWPALMLLGIHAREMNP